jgi:hypothetical protein
MDALMGPLWAVVAILAGVALLALLHFLAAGLRNVTYLHDMRVRVAALRQDRLTRLSASSRNEIVEVDEVPAEPRKAA